MRSRNILFIIAAIAVVAVGFIWYNNNQAEQARLEQQQTEQAAQIAREEELALQEEEAAAALQTAQDPDAPEGVADEGVADTEDELTVVGDEITEDTIVVESASDEQTILDADTATSSSEIIDDEDTAAPLNGAEIIETNTSVAAETPTEPALLLTPNNFDRDEVLALLDDSEQLSADERSSLRAMVEGASASPAMQEATIRSIRAALDLPPLN